MSFVYAFSCKRGCTFPAAERHRPVAGTKLYCLVNRDSCVRTICPGLNAPTRSRTSNLTASRLITHIFNFAYSQLTCSASVSEATALRRYTNVLLLLWRAAVTLPSHGFRARFKHDHFLFGKTLGPPLLFDILWPMESLFM